MQPNQSEFLFLHVYETKSKKYNQNLKLEYSQNCTFIIIRNQDIINFILKINPLLKIDPIVTIRLFITIIFNLCLKCFYYNKISS